VSKTETKATFLEEVRPFTASPTSGSGHVTSIRPAPRLPRLDLAELAHYRELLFVFVWRDLIVRYKQTFLGVLWVLFVPIFGSIVPIFVYGKFAKFPAGNLDYPILVFSGVLVTGYFASAVTTASASVVGNVSLVTKVYFPRVLLPIAGVLVPLVDLFVALSILVGLMAWYGDWPTGPVVLLAFPFIGLALITALGVGFMLSALNVRYRDVPYAIPVFLQMLPLVSGAYLELRAIPTKWQWVMSANPVTAVVSGWRWTMLNGPEPNFWQVGLGGGVAIFLFLIGFVIFRTSEPRFADRI
jgi:homopolymeric O-antigen transport system permease protein